MPQEFLYCVHDEYMVMVLYDKFSEQPQQVMAVVHMVSLSILEGSRYKFHLIMNQKMILNLKVISP